MVLTYVKTKTKIIWHVHAGRRADFFCGVYQLETRFARISINRRDWKWGQTNTTTIATWGHKPIISNGYEDIMREIKQSIYQRDGKCGQTNITTTATWRHEPTILNGSMHPYHTSHPVYFLFCKMFKLKMSEWSGTIKGTWSSRLRTGYPRQPRKEGETAQ